LIIKEKREERTTFGRREKAKVNQTVHSHVKHRFDWQSFKMMKIEKS